LLKVVVTILTYRRPDYLKKTLESFFEMNDADKFLLTMLVQDRDRGTEKVLDKWKNRIHHISYPNVNLGCAGGWNFLMGKTMESGLPYVIHLEDDFVSNESVSNYLPELIKLMKQNNIGCIRLRSIKDKVSSHNIITKKEIKYRRTGNIGIGNGHFTFNPTITKLSVIKKIIPVTREGEAMRKYEKLGLETGQLFANCFSHIGRKKA